MTRTLHRTATLALLASAALALVTPGLVLAATTPTQREALCSLSPFTYQAAKQSYPEAAFAIAELENRSIATWYSDRNGDYMATAKQLVATCPATSRLSVVVYGLPNKDCEARSSAAGSTVTSPDDYKQFIQSLVEIVGDRKVLYVLEPDAVGLLAKEGGCGAQAGYKANLLLAIELLSVNPNAEIYLDVGYWTLAYPESTARVAQVIKDLAAVGRVKGITLNTSNFRSSAEMSLLCANFQESIGSQVLKCIVDTSRNYNGSPSIEWCNLKSAGIGPPPSSVTGFSNLDYFLWIKPPGESDGQCDTGSHTQDAVAGPEPGKFFNEGFKALWNQGFFVKELGLPEITDGIIIPVSATPALAITQAEITSSLVPIASLPTTDSPTMAPVANVGTQETPVEETIPGADLPPTDSVQLTVEAPCPLTGSVSGAADEPVTPFLSQPSSSLPSADTELLSSVEQRHGDAALDERPLSPEVQQQMDNIAFTTGELLRSSDEPGDDGYDDVVGSLPTSRDDPVAEVPESVFFGEPHSLSSSVSSGSGSQAAEIKKITLELSPRSFEISTAASRSGSSSDSISALSAENLVPNPNKDSETATDSQVSTSTGSQGGTNRTEVLATLAVLGCVGALAVAMAVVSHKRKRLALMDARLSTPETTIIHITPASSSVVAL